jgi:nicotinamide mononucleotide transporter
VTRIVTWSEGALEGVNGLALATGVAYAVLAARRNRLCWIAGAVSSVCAAVLAGLNKLPMQAGLQVFYVAMSVYGWWSWKRSVSEGELVVGVWPLGRHLGAALVLAALSLLSAYWLRPAQVAAWPLLDSLTTWFSLLATWLAARARIENWLYWVVINAVMVFLFYAQEVWGMALLSVFLMVIAIGGFTGWRRRLRLQGAPA